MGADGHIMCVKREDWDREVAEGVQPSDIGLYTGTILGVEAVWGYCGDNLYGCGHLGWNNYGDEFYLKYDPDRPENEADGDTTMRRKAALEWFDANREMHEVWT